MGLKKTFQIGKIVDPPEGPEHRLRRRPRPALWPERGPRPLQDDRRRQDLGQGPLRRRQDRRHRHADAPDDPGHPARRHVGAAARRVRHASRRRGAGRLRQLRPVTKWGPAAGSTRRPTAARPSRSSPRACRRARWAGSAWTGTARTRTSSSRSSTREKIGMGTRPSGAAEQRLHRRPSGETPKTTVPHRPRSSTTARPTRPASRPDDVIVAARRQADQEVRGPDERSAHTKPGDKVKVKVNAAATSRRRSRSTLGGGPPALAEAGQGPAGARPARSAASLGGQRENAQDQQGPDGVQNGGVYKSTDGGESWTRINSLNPRPMYFSQVRVDPSDDKYLYVLGVSLYRSHATAARRSRPTAATQRPRRPARPLDRPERRPAHAHRQRRRLLRHLRPHGHTGTT